MKPLLLSVSLMASPVLLVACNSVTTAPGTPVAPVLTSTAQTVQGGVSTTVTAANFTGTPTFTVSPANAGTLSTNGNVATFTPNVEFIGSVTITATSGTQTLSTNITVTPSTSTLPNISGKLLEFDANVPTFVKAWSRGSGTIETVGHSRVPLGSSVVSANGEFVLTLATPNESDLIPFLYGDSPYCTGKITNSDPATLGLGLGPTPLIVKVGSFEAAVANIVTPTDLDAPVVGGLYLYVDRPTRLNGTATCSVIKTEIATYDNVVLKKGWNVVRFEMTTTLDSKGTTVTTRLTNGDVPSTWIVYSMAQPLVKKPDFRLFAR